MIAAGWCRYQNPLPLSFPCHRDGFISDTTTQQPSAGNVLNARRPGGLGRQNRQHFTGSPRHVVHANPPSGKSSRPDGACFRTSGPPGLRPRPRRRKREGTEQQKGGILHVSSLGPSRSSASTECIHSNCVFPEISFPGTEHRRAKHWSRSLGTTLKISIMRRRGGRSAVWRLCPPQRGHDVGGRVWTRMTAVG